MLRICIADNQSHIRHRVVELLEESEHLTIIGQAGSGAELLDLLSDVQADVVLLDLHMPGMTWAGVLARLRRLPVPPRVLAFTAAPADLLMRPVFQAGAAGYLEKSRAVEDLTMALHVVGNGQRYVPSEAYVRSTGRDGILLDLNTTFLTWFNYRRKDLIGLPAEAFPLWADVRRRRTLIDDASSAGAVVRAEACFQGRALPPWNGYVSIDLDRRHAPTIVGHIARHRSGTFPDGTE